MILIFFYFGWYKISSYGLNVKESVILFKAIAP